MFAHCLAKKVAILTCVWSLVSVGYADQFQLKYDPTQGFPEDDGWTRRLKDPNDFEQRDASNGVLKLDTSASLEISDLYQVQSDAFKLKDGEKLDISWRMRTLDTDENGLRSDVAMFISNADRKYVDMFLATDYVSEGELHDGRVKNLFVLTRGRFHSYEFVTTDMDNYSLYVDGAFAFSDKFHDHSGGDANVVSFGDAISGNYSISEWSFVDVSVVPEPNASTLAISAVVTFGIVRRRSVGRASIGGSWPLPS